MRAWVTVLVAASLACSSARDATWIQQEEYELGAAPVPLPPAMPPVERGAIVFRSERSGEGSDLYVMAADGSNVRRLTQGGGYFVPTWAPDGRNIAFRKVQGLDSAIGVMGADGENPVLLVNGEDPQLSDQPLSWQGESILYDSRQEPPESQAWMVPRSGSQGRPMFPGVPGVHRNPSVSAVDGRIAVVFRAELPPGTLTAGQGADLWLLDDAADTEPENVTESRVYSPNTPRWSPDGSRLAFFGWAVDADGNLEGISNHGEGGFAPPDAELFVVDVRTHELTRLTDNEEDDDRPVWTPDGSHLIFTATRAGVEHLWTLPVDAPDQLAPLTGAGGETYLDGMADCFWGAPSE